jgi:hypothetical protein
MFGVRRSMFASVLRRLPACPACHAVVPRLRDEGGTYVLCPLSSDPPNLSRLAHGFSEVLNTGGTGQHCRVVTGENRYITGNPQLADCYSRKSCLSVVLF